MPRRGGPAPKPTGLRLLEGTDRKGRQGRVIDRSTEPVPDDTIPEPPYELSAEVQKVWDFLIHHLGYMGLLAGADVHNMAGYCEAAVLHMRASQTLAKSPILVQGERGLVINKAVHVQEKAARDLLRFSQDFGLTPAARTRIEVQKRGNAPAAPTGNPFAETG